MFVLITPRISSPNFHPFVAAAGERLFTLAAITACASSTDGTFILESDLIKISSNLSSSNPMRFITICFTDPGVCPPLATSSYTMF